MADRWFQSTGKFGLLKVIAPSFFNGFSRGQWQTLIEHLKSNIMEKVSENLLLLCRNLQANGAQFFWDTLYCTFHQKQDNKPLLNENVEFDLLISYCSILAIFCIFLQQLNTNIPRKNCFRRDIRLSNEQSSYCSDYSRSGYDRGHMAPNGNFHPSLHDLLLIHNVQPAKLLIFNSS